MNTQKANDLRDFILAQEKALGEMQVALREARKSFSGMLNFKTYGFNTTAKEYELKLKTALAKYTDAGNKLAASVEAFAGNCVTV